MNFQTVLRLYNDVSDPWLPRAGHPAFEQRRVTIAAGAELLSDAAEWSDALVVLEQGRVEVECEAGSRQRYMARALLCLAWLPLRVLRSAGPGPAVLLAVRRRQPTMGANGDL
jgi:hypothetical protein